MQSSVLVGIIQRLEAMVNTSESELQVRRFELDGVEKCQVKFDPTENMFTLIESQTETEFKFDNLDLVAIEIYELLA